MNNSSGWMVKVLPAALGLGVAWVGINLLRNERRLLHRQLELQQALDENSRKIRKSFLLGELG